MKSAAIRTSLFAATDDADIPDSVASQLAEIFAGDIDFHRDLRQGDHLSAVYESFAFNGREVKSGRVLAAEFVNQGKSLRAVWYADDDAGRTGAYYTPEGKSLRKAFLRSPLEFSRISSGFGLRMHPIQQRWRQHTGVDYAAPEGTRVKATADGIVDFVGQQGGYGNIVHIRHHSGYATWYAHLSAFAKGLRRGMRVAQGDVIGFVGHTGWATGPHLHYEFRVNNQFRNPLAISFPAAQPIAADRLPRFNARTQPLLAQLELLRHSNVALLE
jgi:murein DD-endopeptidase MepM/ murein hydrolase activator NlpD